LTGSERRLIPAMTSVKRPYAGSDGEWKGLACISMDANNSGAIII